MSPQQDKPTGQSGSTSEQSRQQDFGQRWPQSHNPPHPQPQNQNQSQNRIENQNQSRVPESPYPYYPPREGEVIWPPGQYDPSQQAYANVGPSRLPYEPGALQYGAQGHPSSQYPPLDRAFDSGNYQGMNSPPSSDPSMNIMTPNYQYSNTSQHPLRSNDSFTDQTNQNQQFQPNQQPDYPYNSSQLRQASQGDDQAGRRSSSGFNQTTGKWGGHVYGQMGPDPEFRPYITPNYDPNLYPVQPPSSRPPATAEHSDFNTPRSPDRSVSTSGHSVTSPQDAGNRHEAERKVSLDIDAEDEEDWKQLSEPERAVAKLNKRRGQNKIAQRAFRARTRVNKAQATTDLSHLTQLTQAQAKRIDEMTKLVSSLQKENLELRMAAMSGQPVSSSTDPPPSASAVITIPPPKAEDDDEQMEQEQHEPTPSKKKRTSRTLSENDPGPPKPE